MHLAHIHMHFRRHMRKKLLKYPHPSLRIRLLDGAALLASVIIPLTSLPQAYNVWVVRDMTGVSLLTWLSFSVLAVPFLFYGVVHRVRPMLVCNILWVSISAFIAAGILLYG